jgi:hypothetical protein
MSNNAALDIRKYISLYQEINFLMSIDVKLNISFACHRIPSIYVFIPVERLVRLNLKLRRLRFDSTLY